MVRKLAALLAALALGLTPAIADAHSHHRHHAKRHHHTRAYRSINEAVEAYDEAAWDGLGAPATAAEWRQGMAEAGYTPQETAELESTPAEEAG